MELNYDWKSFQGVFHPQRRSGALDGVRARGPIYAVVDSDVILTAYSEGEDLSDWAGASWKEMSGQIKHRELHAYDRQQVDQWMDGCTALPHFFAQIESLRKKVVSLEEKGSSAFEYHEHFMLEALRGWWNKVLPSSYGVFIRLEGHTDRTIFMLVRRGEFEAFHQPDLTSLGAQRRRQPAEVVKYLSEKYLVPVQGVFVPATEWNEWSSMAFPWTRVLKSVRSQHVRLYPARVGVISLVALRGLLHF